MFWIYIALFAYLINAVTFIVDKYILALPVQKPYSYAFWVAILSTPIIFLAFVFPIQIHSLFFLNIALLSGAAFFIGLISLYKAIEKSDVSVASTQTFTFTPIFTYMFASFFLEETLPNGSTLGILLLIPGIFLLGKHGTKQNKNILKYALTGGLFFGLSFTLLKWTFMASDLITGIFWTRIGLISAALISLLNPRIRKEISSSFQKSTSSLKMTLIGNKLLGTVGFLLLYISIGLGSVSLVNALLGFQFLFIFVIALLLRNKVPSLKEDLERRILIQKLIGFALIITGFIVIVL